MYVVRNAAKGWHGSRRRRARPASLLDCGGHKAKTPLLQNQLYHAGNYSITRKERRGFGMTKHRWDHSRVLALERLKNAFT